MGGAPDQLAESTPFPPCASDGAVWAVCDEAPGATGVICSHVSRISGGFGGGCAPRTGDDVADDPGAGTGLSVTGKVCSCDGQCPFIGGHVSLRHAIAANVFGSSCPSHSFLFILFLVLDQVACLRSHGGAHMKQSCMRNDACCTMLS